MIITLCAYIYTFSHVPFSALISFNTLMQGVNTPDSILDISCLTPKDREDLEFMLSIGVDWVALSFGMSLFVCHLHVLVL